MLKGKSSFINKLLGLSPQHPGAAPVGVTETTLRPTAYRHPANNNVIFWDLPGIGTPNFPKAKYLQTVGFEKYDFFLILSENRFLENDKYLAQQIRESEKNFFFVKTKVGTFLKQTNKIKISLNSD